MLAAVAAAAMPAAAQARTAARTRARARLVVHSRVNTSPWAILPARASAATRRTDAIYNRALRATLRPRVTDTCDWGNPFTGQGVVEDPFIDLGGIYLDGDREKCGVELFENDAYDIYAQTHGLASGDPQILLTGQPQIAGIFWALVNQLVETHQNNPSALTSDDQGAYDWLQKTVVSTPLVAAAQHALDEYSKWAAAPCNYSPPNTKLFDFTPLVDPACGTTTAALLRGPTPPSYENFLEYGQYDAGQAISPGLKAQQYSALQNEQIGEGAGIGASLFMGAASHIVANLAPSLLKRYVKRVYPSSTKGKALGDRRQARARRQKRTQFREQETEQELEDATQDEKLLQNGAKEDKVLSETVNKVETEGEKVGEKLITRGFEFGAEVLDGPVIIVSFAIDILVSEATNIAAEVAIPDQLKANLDQAKKQTLDDLLEGTGADGGYQTTIAYFKSHLLLQAPKIGTTGAVINSAPFGGSEWEVTQTTPFGGAALKTTFQPTVNLVTWPLGIDRGVNGLHQTPFAIFHGQVWHQVTGDSTSSDDVAAGLQGWLPSGELRYFDWQGNPRIAIVDGNRFLDMPSPGSEDLGGQDASDLCAEGDAECTPTNVLFVTASAPAGVNSSNTIFACCDSSGNIGVEQQHQDSNGTLNTFDSRTQLIRLTIKPDAGAQAAQSIDNQWGNGASTVHNPTFHEGGLFAGDTVTLSDGAVNPLGYQETYTWKVESRCAYQATCVKDSDPAFHGNPTVTLTGQSIAYTWPAPGTYHVRLTTTDQYGATQVSDQDVTVDGVNPTVALGSSTGFAGASVMGPVKNGSPQTITGCIDDPDNAYVDPQVTMDWGDGTTETQSGRSGGSSTLSFHYGTTSDCPQQWQFSATHTYNLPAPPAGTQVQKPLHISLNDGFGDSTARDLAINVDFTSVPQITSDSSATFPAGTSGTFIVRASGTPTPTLSLQSGSLPPGVQLEPQGGGTALITGATGAPNAGDWPITIQASNTQGNATQSFTLHVTTPPNITSPSSATVAVNHNSTVNISASGSPSPGVTISGTVPPGMQAVDSTGGGTGSITGTPTAIGTYPLTVTADSPAGSTSQAFTLVVGSVPAFTSSSSADFVQPASASTFKITTSGFPAPLILCSPCTLPNGLSFHDNGDGTAQIFGSATTSEADQVTLNATSGAGTAQQTLTVTSSASGGPNVTITSGATFDSSSGSWTAPMKEGSAGSVSISASGQGQGPSQLFELGNLPTGLTFTDHGDGTATLSGTPDAGTGGSYGLEIKAHPSSPGNDGFAFVELQVEGPPTMTSSPTAVFTSGQAGSFTVRTAGLPRAAISTADTLPDGLHLTDNGDGTATIAGTPAADAVGQHPITVQMENLASFPSSVTAPLTIEVDQAPAITSGATVGFGEGRSDSFTLTTSGSPAPTLQVVSGNLPGGITFKDNGDGTGTLSGTPTDTVDTSYAATVLASSQAGQAAQTLTIAIGPAPTVASADTANFQVGSDGLFLINSPTTPAPSFSVTGLPAGLSLTDSGSGAAAIHGNPDSGTGGVYAVTVTATNAYGSTAKDISLTVAEAPTFAGTEAGLSCAEADPTVKAESFLSTGGWTLCVTGYPTPQLGVAGTLPSGITFKDKGDGSALISGKADPGKGGPIPLALIATNTAGRVQVPLTLTVDQPVAQIPRLETTFVAGQSNTYTISAPGYPLPKISLFPRACGAAPDWLTFQDNGDGTATLTGNPPNSAIGNEFDFGVREEQGVGNGALPCVALTVAPVTLVDKSPPASTVGSGYDYKFTSTDPTATYSVVSTGSTVASHLSSASGVLAAGDLAASHKGTGVLPPGLHLSKSGVLSGTPTTVGSWVFRIVVTSSKGRAVSGPITIHGRSAKHQLEIRAFRVYGPAGALDWFVTARNVSRVTMPLFGWEVAIFPPGLQKPLYMQLPVGWLRPGEDITVAGPSFSLARRARLVAGLSRSRIPGGFELVAPDGRVVDRAGMAGGPKATIAGAGVPAPRKLGAQSAYVRKRIRGHLVDTENNARDFTYEHLAVAQTQVIRFTSSPPRPAAVGSRYRVNAVGGGSGKKVKFGISGRATKRACKLVSADLIRFTRVGTCVIKATQLGNLRYYSAQPVYQRILVRRHGSVLDFVPQSVGRSTGAAGGLSVANPFVG